MICITTQDTASPNPDDVVVPADTAGEVIGGGWTDANGVEYVAVDFGNLICDINVKHLKSLEEWSP